MTTEEIQLIVTFPIKARVTSDSVSYVKAAEAKKRVAKWVAEELVIIAGYELDITNGSGEVEVFDIEEINVELI